MPTKKILLGLGVIALIAIFSIYTNGEKFKGFLRLEKTQSTSFETMTPALQQVLQGLGNEKISIEIILKQQADTRNIRGNYQEIRQRKEKITQVRENQTATSSFRKTIEKLAGEGHIENIQKFWLVNSYSLFADKTAITQIATNNEVRFIDLTPEIILDDSEDSEAYPDFALNNFLWHTKVFQAWEMGYKGDNIHAGIIDSNVFADHPNLQEKIITFFDSGSGKIVDPNTQEPQPHGTHVTGIVVGGKATGVEPLIDFPQFHKWIDNTAGNGLDIGVAPNAKYFFSNKNNASSAFQWMADPDGNPETTDYPIVINCSWHPNYKNFALYYWLNALDDLGITIVVAAGNNDSPASIAETWNFPTLLLVANYSTYQKSINIGLSSQGPITYQEEQYIKPDISAPGMGVISSVKAGHYIDEDPDKGLPLIYKQTSGTSMAAPMVTGAVALIQQAHFEKNGSYLSPDKVKSILQLTANDLGNDQTKDNSSGAGLLDVKAAIDLALSHGTLKGTITNNEGQPVAFSKITFQHNEIYYELNANHNGEYELALPAGSYDFSFQKYGKTTNFQTDIIDDVTKLQNIILDVNSAFSVDTDSIPTKIELILYDKQVALTGAGPQKVFVDSIIKNAKGDQLSFPVLGKITEGEATIMMYQAGNSLGSGKVNINQGYEGPVKFEFFLAEMPDIKAEGQIIALKEEPTKISISPQISALSKNSLKQFSAKVYYSNGQEAYYPYIIWSLVGVGTIDEKGLYSAGNKNGTAEITAKTTDNFLIKSTLELKIIEGTKLTPKDAKDLQNLKNNKIENLKLYPKERYYKK